MGTDCDLRWSKMSDISSELLKAKVGSCIHSGGLQRGHGGVGLVPGRLMPQSLTSNFNITVVQGVGVAPMGVMMVVASVGAHGGRLDQVGVAFRRAVAGAVVHHDL